jgi:hypothetical protein
VPVFCGGFMTSKYSSRVHEYAAVISHGVAIISTIFDPFTVILAY